MLVDLDGHHHRLPQRHRPMLAPRLRRRGGPGPGAGCRRPVPAGTTDARVVLVRPGAPPHRPRRPHSGQRWRGPAVPAQAGVRSPGPRSRPRPVVPAEARRDGRIDSRSRRSPPPLQKSRHSPGHDHQRLQRRPEGKDRALRSRTMLRPHTDRGRARLRQARA